MTQPAPVPDPPVPPAPQPQASIGFLGHIREFFERDIEPSLEAARADLERFRELAPHLQALAGVVETLTKTLPGVSPQAVAEAEEAAAAVARIAGELAAAGM